MIGLMSEHTFLRGPKNWWRQAVVYQIYPRSFADYNGDGIGDYLVGAKGANSTSPNHSILV